MTSPNLPLSRKDIALNLIEQIKIDVENESIDDVALQLEQLNQHIGRWQRNENLQTSRLWLDDALKADLLTFDIGKAQDYLRKWSEASDNPEENPELADYRNRVAMRAKQKNEALLVRGVISHSNEILEQADTLERGNEPPAPSFILREYYEKVRNIVLSARAEHDKNSELEQLIQRVDRLHQHKETASMLYSMALESKKYSNALNNLAQFPSDFLVPRFTSIEDTNGDIRLNYQGMVGVDVAQQEITSLAQTWASQVTNDALLKSQQLLEAHEPQEAIEELDLSENIQKFLSADLKTNLEKAQSDALIQLRNREKAEELAKTALDLADTKPLDAWSDIIAAQNLYEWAHGLGEARQATLTAMRAQLEALAHEADVEFHEKRNMVRVREISTYAQSNYANKDESLTTQLQAFDEFDDMVQHYQEYISAGNDLIAKVKSLIWDDTVAANDFLTQIESYPEFVLEAFDGLYELRVQVNQRLNANQRYSELYQSLFSETLSDITTSLEKTSIASNEFENDDRFPKLENWLSYHMAFITAQAQFEQGASEKSLQLIAPVLNHPKHPDYESARKMSEVIRASQEIDEDENREN